MRPPIAGWLAYLYPLNIILRRDGSFDDRKRGHQQGVLSWMSPWSEVLSGFTAQPVSSGEWVKQRT